jgi:hypothetical protein
MSLVELPRKYSLLLLGEELVIIDEETKDVAKISLNPPKVVFDALRNKGIAVKVLRALTLFETYNTPPIKSFL